MSEDICGITKVINGKEWICIKPVHAKTYIRKRGSKTHKKGDIVYDDSHTAKAHHFVRKFPLRDVQEDSE